MSLHTQNVNFTNMVGEWWKGKDETGAGLKRVHTTVFVTSRTTLRIEQVRLLTQDVAVVHGTMELHNVPLSAQGECVFMRVLMKQNGGWLIDDFQNTLIRRPESE